MEASGREIGRSMPRAATRRLVAGRGRYLDDVSVKGELHAAFLRSPHAHAAFTVVDTSAAAGLNGVVAIYTAADLARAGRSWRCESLSFPGLVSPEQGPLAAGEALFQGEAIAMAVATSRAIAEDALEHVGVEWEELGAATSPLGALAEGAPVVQRGLDSNLAWQTEMIAGDVEAAFARAAFVVEDRLVFDRKTGTPLETRGILASFDPSTDALLVHASHQMPHQLQLYLAEIFGLAMSDVRVVCHDVGGAFGVKMHVYPDEVAVCAASKLLGRPVKYVADRIESLMTDTHAREHVISARMAVDADGMILGFDVDDVQGLGAYSVYPRSSSTEGMSVLRPFGGPYRYAHFRGRLRCVLQNKAMTGQYRSVGHPIACAMTERLIDLAAAVRGEDAIDFRLRNVLPADAMPCTSPQGGAMIDLSHEACLAGMAELLDLPALRQEIRRMRDDGRLVGLGLSCFLEFTATAAAGYGRAGISVGAIDTVSVALDPSGEVKALCSASEIGQGIQQGIAQVVADALGVSSTDIRVVLGDTAVVPHGGGAWSSRGAAITGEAAWKAGRTLRHHLLEAAGAMLQAAPNSLDIRAGAVVDRDTGQERIGLAELARLATFQGYAFPEGTQPQLSATHTYGRDQHPGLPTNGVQAALVEIDPGTGIVTPLRHWVVEDCGRVINPLLVDEQIRGGVVQGIGEALFEACRYDDGGQFTSATLSDYLVPMAGEMPDIVVRHVETPYSGSVIGAKGAGEAGTCAAPSAILNAVNDALAPHGASVRTLPITPVVVLRALDALNRDEAA